jgi:hypothetical protein
MGIHSFLFARSLPFFEFLHLPGLESAGVTRLKSSEGESGKPYAFELQDWVTEFLPHSLDLPIFPFIKNHLQPQILFGLSQGEDLARGRSAIFQIDAPTELVNLLRGRFSFYFYLVGAGDTKGGVRQPVGELTVIGQEKKPLRIVIQPPHWKQARFFYPQQIHDRFPSCRVVGRRHSASGLV